MGRKTGGSAGGAKFAVSIAIHARDLASRVVRGVADGLRRSLDSIKAKIRSTVDFVAKLGTAFATVGAGIVSVARKIGSALMDTSDRLSKIADVSKKTGVAATVLQELEYAAGQTGVETESLFKGIETLNRKMGQMKAGSKEMSSFLLRVGGPAFLKQVQGAKSTEDALELMLTAMGKIEDPAKRAAFGMAAFGKSGEDLALLLGDGANELRRMRTEAHEFSVQGDESVATAAEFGDEIEKLKKGAGFVMDTAAIEAMRLLLPDVKALTTYFKENRESVAALARDIGGGIADAIRGIKDAVVWIYDHREAILDWAKALAVVFGAGGILGSVSGIVAGLKLIGGGGAAAGAAGAAATAGGAAARGSGGGVLALAARLSPYALVAATLATDQGAVDVAGQKDREGIQAYRKGVRLRPLGGVAPVANMIGRGRDEAFEGFRIIADRLAALQAPGVLTAPGVVTDRYGKGGGKTELVVTLRGPAAEQATVTEVTGAPVTIKKTGTRSLGGGW